MFGNYIGKLLFSFLLIIGIFGVLSTNRTDFYSLIGYFSIASIAYLILVFKFSFERKEVIGLSILLCAVCFIFQPELSNDYYRFLWDGEIYWQGNNPFNHLPFELTSQSWFIQSEDLQDLYGNISQLSKKHYSCYPPINQLYFKAVTYCSDSITINLLVLRLLVLITQVVGVVYLRKVLNELNKPKHLILWILFNPLILIETIGNLHFEGVMISFLVIAFYFTLKHRHILASIFFTLAINIKLTPLLLLPVLIRYLGWYRSFISFGIIGVLTIAFFGLELDQNNIHNFYLSLRLYFKGFEFNSFMYFNILHIYHYFTDNFIYTSLGSILSLLTVIIILCISFIKRSTGDTQQWLFRMLIAYSVYLLLSSNMHPWYVIPVILLGALTEVKYVIYWSLLVFLSYIFYANFDKEIVRFVVNLEHLLLLAIISFEWWKSKTQSSFLGTGS